MPRWPGSPWPAPPTAAALGAAAVLAATAAYDPTGLYWLAAALGVTTSLGLLAASLHGRRAGGTGRRPPRRPATGVVGLTSVVVLTTGLTASWVGATSASADWFGSVISHGPRQVPEVAVTFDGVPDAETADKC